MKKVAIILCIAFIAISFADVTSFIDGSRRGIMLFGQNVLPVLFPFFFVTSMLVELDFFTMFRRLGKNAPIWCLSTLGGYPTGARIIAELYTNGKLTRTQAIKISTSTTTVSPIFIIATIGICFLGSAKLGAILFGCHILSAILNGFIYRKVNFVESNITRTSSTTLLLNTGNLRNSLNTNSNKDISDIISNSLYSAIQNILMVGGIIIIFFIVINQIQNVLGVESIIFGLFELTNGVIMTKNLVLLSAIISFGGIAIAMQGLLFFKTFRMPFWFYLTYKTTHAILAVVLCIITLNLFILSS